MNLKTLPPLSRFNRTSRSAIIQCYLARSKPIEEAKTYFFIFLDEFKKLEKSSQDQECHRWWHCHPWRHSWSSRGKGCHYGCQIRRRKLERHAWIWRCFLHCQGSTEEAKVQLGFFQLTRSKATNETWTEFFIFLDEIKNSFKKDHPEVKILPWLARPSIDFLIFLDEIKKWFK